MRPSKSFSIAIVGAFAALLALVAIPARPEVAPSSSPALAAFRAAPENAAAARQDQSLLLLQRERSESLPWGRDPFLPTFVPELVAGDVEPDVDTPQGVAQARLTGISLMNDVYLAIIDHRIVRTGDALPSGHVVAAITPTSVELRRGAQSITLSLGVEQ